MIKLKHIFTAAAIGTALLITGCASAPTMDRNEFLTSTSRTYDGVTEEQFFAAAKRLFELSDPSDVKFAYPGPHAMIVQHNWSIFLILAFTKGQDVWRISTEPTANGLNARVYVSQTRGGGYGGLTGGGGAYGSAVSAPANAVATPAVYELFWLRMDYLLGKKTRWANCIQWQANVDLGKTYGDIGALCGFPIWDGVPTQAASR